MIGEFAGNQCVPLWDLILKYYRWFLYWVIRYKKQVHPSANEEYKCLYNYDNRIAGFAALPYHNNILTLDEWGSCLEMKKWLYQMIC